MSLMQVNARPLPSGNSGGAGDPQEGRRKMRLGHPPGSRSAFARVSKGPEQGDGPVEHSRDIRGKGKGLTGSDLRISGRTVSNGVREGATPRIPLPMTHINCPVTKDR